jgi:hypothetical protein
MDARPVTSPAISEHSHAATELPVTAAARVSYVRFAGLAALALALASVALNGAAPGNGTSGARAAAWFDHQPLRHVLATWLAGAGSIALLCFLRELEQHLDLPAGGILPKVSSSLANVVTTLLLLGVAPVMAGAMTAHERDMPLPAASAEVFLHLGIGIYLLAVIALGAYLVATGVLMLRSPTAPRWLGHASLGGGALAATPLVGFLGLVAVLPLWILAATCWLALRERNHST